MTTFKINVVPESTPFRSPEKLPEMVIAGQSSTVKDILDRFSVTGQVQSNRDVGGFTSKIDPQSDVNSDDVQNALDTPDYDGLDDLEMMDVLNNSLSMHPASSGESSGDHGEDPPPAAPPSENDQPTEPQ